MLKRLVSLALLSGLFVCAITGAALADKPLNEDQLKTKKLADITHARELYVQGEKAYNKGYLQNAITFWLQALELKPDSDYTKQCLKKARAALAAKFAQQSKRLEKNGDFLSELIMIDPVLQLDPDDPILLQRLDKIKTQLTDDDKKAKTSYDGAIAAYAKADYPGAYESIKAALTYGRGSECVEDAYHSIEKAYNAGAKSINWKQDYDEAVKEARNAKMPLVVDFYADWCGWCKKLDRDVYTDPDVMKLSQKFICVKVDGDKHADWGGKYNISGYPTIVFLDSTSKEVNRVTGYEDAKQFLRDMRDALK